MTTVHTMLIKSSKPTSSMFVTDDSGFLCYSFPAMSVMCLFAAPHNHVVIVLLFPVVIVLLFLSCYVVQVPKGVIEMESDRTRLVM